MRPSRSTSNSTGVDSTFADQERGRRRALDRLELGPIRKQQLPRGRQFGVLRAELRVTQRHRHDLSKTVNAVRQIVNHLPGKRQTSQHGRDRRR